MRKSRIIRGGITVVAMIAVSLNMTRHLHAGEFKLDEHTLLLGHFNETALKADYANGNESFAGSARLAEGYYGKGADLRVKGCYPDYMRTCDLPTPFFSKWGFWPVGNFNYYQGTLEFFFNLDENDTKYGNLVWAYNGGLYYSYVKLRDGKTLSLRWSCLKKLIIEDTIHLDKELTPGEWHHFAMTWCESELAVWLDGRCVGSYDISGGVGLCASRAIQPVWIGSEHWETNYTSMIIDEFRISNIVRYQHDFEPNWREGQRPAYAIEGNEKITWPNAKYETPYIPRLINKKSSGREFAYAYGDYSLVFDKEDGLIKEMTRQKDVGEGVGGLLVYEGIDRIPLFEKSVASGWKENDGELRFTQKCGGKVVVRNTLNVEDGVLFWNARIENASAKELWLETLLALPASMMETLEYFDGNSIHANLSLPRRLAHTVSTMPLGVIADDERSIGIGVDPRQAISFYCGEWVPVEGARGELRQGARVAIGPGESYELRFMVIAADGEFGVKDVMSRYHDSAPELYKVRKRVSPRLNMPCSNYVTLESVNPQRRKYGPQGLDWARHMYCGHEWEIGPHHVIGDFWPHEEWFNNPKWKGKSGYHHWDGHYQKYGKTIPDYKKRVIQMTKNSYDNNYTSFTLHLHPNWPWIEIVKALYPEGVNEGDRRDCGQYYTRSFYQQVNCHETPIGKMLQDNFRNMMNFAGKYLIGFINDINYTCGVRCYDPIAKKTPGRAWERDVGTFVLDGIGVADYINVIDGGGKGMVSDGGWCSHVVSSAADKCAVESETNKILNQHQMHLIGRYLMGEKPYGFFGFKDTISLSPTVPNLADFTEKDLRDLYRYLFFQEYLLQSKLGAYVSLHMLRGIPELISYRAMKVEGALNGVKTVSAAKVKKPLWVMRYGDGLNTIIVVGNHEPKDMKTDVGIYNKYLGDDHGSYVFTGFFADSSVVQKSVDAGGDFITVLDDVEIKARDLAGFRAVAKVQGEFKEIIAAYKGNGVEFNLIVTISCPKDQTLIVTPFLPADYRVASVFVNGEKRPNGDSITLNDKCDHYVVRVAYSSVIYDFTPEEWKKVELLKGDKGNYQIKTADDASPYVKGTAKWLDGFFYYYDEADGKLGDIDLANVGNEAWMINYQTDGIEKSKNAKVKIDAAKKTIWIGGPTKETARKAMCAFLRLLDRKYPKAGTWYVLNERTPYRHKYKLGGLRKNSKGKDFPGDEALHDLYVKYDFHKKLLFKDDSPYEPGKIDFRDQLKLKFSPYVFEPAYPTYNVHASRGD